MSTLNTPQASYVSLPCLYEWAALLIFLSCASICLWWAHIIVCEGLGLLLKNSAYLTLPLAKAACPRAGPL